MEGTQGVTTMVWFDNQTSLGPLFKHPLEISTCHDLKEIRSYLTSEGWDFNGMLDLVPCYVIEHVNSTMEKDMLRNQKYKPWWIHTIFGTFTFTSARNLLRQRKEEN